MWRLWLVCALAAGVPTAPAPLAAGVPTAPAPLAAGVPTAPAPLAAGVPTAPAPLAAGVPTAPAPPGCRCRLHEPPHLELSCDVDGKEVLVSWVGVSLQVECDGGARVPELGAWFGKAARGAIAQVVVRRCVGGPAEVAARLGAGGTRALEILGGSGGQVRGAALAGVAHLAVREAAGAWLPAGALTDLSSLVRLDLRATPVHLNAQSFFPAPALRVLDLSRTALAILPPALFHPLSGLLELHLRKNALRELHRDQFQGLVHLRLLDLSDNSVSEMPKGIFDDLQNISTINMMSNSLQSLPESLFKYNMELTSVILSHNRKLRALPHQLFANLPHLEEVTLSHCGLEGMPSDVFSAASVLANLTLSHNYITELPDDLLETQALLAALDLSYNKLKLLNKATFRNLKHLEDLYLNDNQIEQLPRSAFTSLARLKTLNLDNNLLKELASDIFSPASSITFLSLAHNDLRFSTSSCSAFADVPHIQFINMSYNKFQRICKEWRELEELKVLDLIFNNISAVVEDELSFRKGVDVEFGEGEVVEEHVEGVRVVLKHNPLLQDCPRGCHCRAQPPLVQLRCPAMLSTRLPLDLPLSMSRLGLRLEAPSQADLVLPPLPSSLTKLDLSGLNVTSLLLDGLPDTIKMVDLSSNHLSRVRPWARLLEAAGHVRLAGNSFPCSCSSWPDLELLLRHQRKIVDFDTIYCSDTASKIPGQASQELCGIRGSQEEIPRAEAGTVAEAGLAAGTQVGLGLGAAVCAVLAVAAAGLVTVARRRRRVRVECAREDEQFVAECVLPELQQYRVTVVVGAAAPGAVCVRGAGAVVQVVRGDSDGAGLAWRGPGCGEQLRRALTWGGGGGTHGGDRAGLIPTPSRTTSSHLDNVGYCDGFKVNPQSVHSEV